MASESEMQAALMELLQASYSPESMGQVLERRRAIMLNPTFLQYCRRSREMMRLAQIGNKGGVTAIERFLQNAIEHGVTYAINEEHRIAGRLFEIAKGYLVVEPEAACGYVKQHQSALVSDEGIQVMQVLIDHWKQNISLSREVFELMLTTFELKLRLLEEALTRSIDEACRRYLQSLQQLMS